MLIKFAISTNINFEEKTLPIVVPSLLDAGIDPDLIHVFSGGYDQFDYSKKKVFQREVEYHYYKLDHMSCEYSPLIEIVDKQFESEYWFLVHDTCKFGPDFKELVYAIPESRPEKIALTVWPSMSIGSYRYDYLLTEEVRKNLQIAKNTDYSVEGIKNHKSWGAENEDFILHGTEPPAAYYRPELGIGYHMQHVDNNNWYGTETARKTEYFLSLDLYKNKSNWTKKKTHKYVIDI